MALIVAGEDGEKGKWRYILVGVVFLSLLAGFRERESWSRIKEMVGVLGEGEEMEMGCSLLLSLYSLYLQVYVVVAFSLYCVLCGDYKTLLFIFYSGFLLISFVVMILRGWFFIFLQYFYLFNAGGLEGKRLSEPTWRGEASGSDRQLILCFVLQLRGGGTPLCYVSLWMLWKNEKFWSDI